MIDPRELTSNRINDRLAATYGVAFDANFTQFLKYSLLDQHTRPADICLDVGIATGIFALPLAAKVQAVHGVDISGAMLQQCRDNSANANLKNIFLYERSATNLLFDAAAFDVVYSYSTLLLVPEPEQAYREIVRVLKPGGIALLDITGKYNLSRIHWNRYYRQQGHFGLNCYALAEISAIFASLGLEIMETHATGLLDQWKYLRGVQRLQVLERIVHGTRRAPDLDYKLSQKVPTLANRWYFVLCKH